MAKSFSFSFAKEIERQELAARVDQFLREGGKIEKAELPKVFPVPRPPHISRHRVIHGYGGRTAYERTDGKGVIEE